MNDARAVPRVAARALISTLLPYVMLLLLALWRGPWTRDLGPFLLLWALACWACVRAARTPLGPRAILFGAVLFRLLFVALPPMLSDDIYRYVWEGRVQNAGFDPFVLAPSAAELTALRDADWIHINHPEYTAIYPPLAQLVFRVGAALGGVTWFKILFCGADLALVMLLVRTLQSRGEPPARAVLYAWHPLAVLEVASSGHLEPLGILPLVGAIVWVSRVDHFGVAQPAHHSGVASRSSRAPIAAGVALAASIAVKYGAALVAPFWWRRLGARGWIACLATMAALFALYLPAGQHLFASLHAYAEHWRFNDLGFALLAQCVADPRRARAIAAAIAIAGLLLAMRLRVPLERRILTTLGIALFVSPTVHAWYLLWPLALVPLAPSVVMSAWSATIALAYLLAHPAFGLGPITSVAGSWGLRCIEMAPVAAAWLWTRRRT